ncbi:MAG TPA: S46 family peptidase [Ignavibacteriaceae bacterium]|nr:S46 family peptidase [Ignavibacteriaceae bacterium]
MLKVLRLYVLSLILLSIYIIVPGCSSSQQTTRSANNDSSNEYSWLDLDTVKAGKFDMGKMWTFEYPPLDYFQQEYNFKPTQEWLDHIRKSALRFANYCSASFVSADGLVMTNDHCGRESVVEVTKEGEDLMKDGFFASTLADERKVPGLYVDQLVLIKDVTNEIQNAVDKGATIDEKTAIEDSVKSEIEKSEEDKTGLRISVIPLYNGGKYSEYGYKRYDDVRLVFAPETQMGYFGGDPDNFTYPRFDLDCTFFRVYDENGKPLQTKDYFKWSEHGADPGEAVFVVGNPGNSNRLSTVAQLEYLRDISYPQTLEIIQNLVDLYNTMMQEHPDKQAEMQSRYMMFTNSQKAYMGMLKGLRDPVLMQKKKDFEEKFKSAVMSNHSLKEKYGDIWDKIAGASGQLKSFSKKIFALSVNPLTSSKFFIVANDVVDLANELKLPEDQRDEQYTGEMLDSTIDEIFPGEMDMEMERKLLKDKIKIMDENLGAEDPLVQKMTGGRIGDEAVDYILSNTLLTDSLKLRNLIDQGPDAILSSNDPFIYFAVHTESAKRELRSEVRKITDEESIYSQQLGQALFAVYGTSVPPDATFTLRLSDGVVKGFPYNGTIAPPFTTFYGLYDRYYSFGKKAPWNLPQRWINPPSDFDLEVPFNFVATNDIIGGNSGSPVINENAEVVGLAFDGNIESLPGDFIYDPDENRMVAVHSAGLMEAIKHLYRATRLSDELENGKIMNEVALPDTTK